MESQPSLHEVVAPAAGLTGHPARPMRYEDTDGYFATLPEAELERELDLTAMGLRPAGRSLGDREHPSERGAPLR